MESTPQSKESTASTDVTHPRKRNSNDVGWEFGIMADPNDPDKVQCLKCKKVVSGGVYRIKQHIAGIMGSVKACTKSSNEDKIKCRNALNEAKNKKKAKQDRENVLRAEVNISNDETIDLDEMEDSFGNLKPSKSFGPIDRFAKLVDKGTSKQTNLSNAIRKEQMIAYKEYICRWAYECAIPFHVFERDSFVQVMQAVGQFGPNGPPPTRYEIGDTFLKKEVERTKGLMKKYEEEWESIGCSIMTDAWSNRKRRSIRNLCLNSKLGTIFISAKDCSDKAHTSEHIFEYVDKCIEDVGAENVVQVVTDNASNNMGAAKLLNEKRPKIFWTSCATHTINLMLEGNETFTLVTLTEYSLTILKNYVISLIVLLPVSEDEFGTLVPYSVEHMHRHVNHLEGYESTRIAPGIIK
ncbi:putative transcription factor/ chromatin remodeling BED-type(Zn) family protein [Tanacetum coccineum]